MSNTAMLEQAKKEAKRLLRLARSENSSAPQLHIKNLHDAKEIVAKLQGYPSWAAFESTKSSIATPVEKNITQPAMISEITGPNTTHTLSGVLKKAMLEPVNIELDDNFTTISNSDLLKYRFKNETKIPFVKKRELPWTIGVKHTQESGLFNLTTRTKSENFNFEFNELRSHIQMAGSNYNERHDFLMNMAQIQMRKGDPLIYFDSTYNEDTVEELRGFAYHLSKQSNLDTSSVRVLRLDDSAATDPNNSSIDPFEEFPPEILCDFLMYKSFDKDNMWYGRASGMLQPVFKALFELRTKINLVLDIETLRFAISLEGLAFLYKHPFVSMNVKLNIQAYLKRMPGVFYTDSIITGDSSVREHHEYLVLQIEESLHALEKGYTHGYFSSTPTDSLQEIIERNLILYVSTNAQQQPGSELKFLMSFILKKIRYVMFKQFHSQIKTDDALTLIIMDDLIFTNDLIDWGDLLSASRALGYCCVFSSCSYFYDQHIDVNTANKILFKLDDSQLAKSPEGWLGSTIPTLLEQYSSPTLINDLRNLQSGECYCLNKNITKISVTTPVQYSLPPTKELTSPEPRFTFFKANEC